MTPTPDTDRAAAIAAMSDTSPFAQGFWRELAGNGTRADAIARFGWLQVSS